MIRRNLGRLYAQLNDGRRKLWWVLRNGASATTAPVFIIGSQRSGTGMLGDVLGKSPEIENLGESDSRAFEHYFIRDDQTIQHLLRDCRYRFMVFKPLKDSERIRHLLSLSPSSKALWAYRFYMDRINSAVKEFGRHPLEVFDAFAKGQRNAWQMRAIDPHVEKTLKQFNVAKLTAHEGAALMWWVRNSLYFTLDLESESRIRLWSYDAFVRDSGRELKSLLGFIGANEYPYMLEDVHADSFRKDAEPVLNADIRELCQALYERLELASARQSS